jgi:hypothetical protein
MMDPVGPYDSDMKGLHPFCVAVQGAMLTLNLIRDVITDMCYCDTCRPLVRALLPLTVLCRGL